MNNENNKSGSNSMINTTNQQKQPNNNSKPQTSRQQVDNAVDGAGSQALQKLGVPKKVSDKAIKNNGGAFSPANLPANKAMKNKSRNALAGGLDKLKGNKPTNQNSAPRPGGQPGQNKGRQLLNSMGGNAKPQDEQAVKRQKQLNRALKVAKHVPIPQVKAAATAAEKLKKTGLGKKLMGGKSGGLLGGNNGGSNPIDITGIILRRKIIMFAIPLFLMIIILVTLMTSVSTAGSEDAEDMNDATCVLEDGTVSDDCEDEGISEEAKSFNSRIKDIRSEYKEAGKKFNPIYITAVYKAISKSSGNSELEYDDFTTEKIKEIADAMFKEDNDSYTFDAKTFENNLISNLLPKYVPGKTKKEYESIAGEIFDFADRYKDTYNLEDDYDEDEEDIDDIDTCSTGGTCSYTIDGQKVNGLKIRLGQCSPPYGQGVAFKSTGEKLVDFEHYVFGVAYGEVGDGVDEEAFKAQVIFARTYTMRRKLTSAQNIKNNVKTMRNCVADQVYCDPDTGCYKLNDGDQGGQVRQGTSSTHSAYKNKLAANSKLRAAAASVTGIYFTGGQADFTNTKQSLWSSYAAKGYDYKQIVIATGGSNVKIRKGSCGGSSNNCDSGSAGSNASGKYTTWKQYTGPWTGIHLGNSSETIRSAGCTATSIAMLIVKSGTKTTVDGKFNPGTFVKKLSANGGFTGSGALNWGAISSAAPNFKVAGDVRLTGDKSHKLNQIKDVLKKGYYPIVQLNGGQHWVAVDSVKNSSVRMLDPGSSSTNMWSKYSVSGTIRMVYFKAS